MRRPVGVIIAGILLGILAVLGTAVGALALGVSVYAHRPVVPKIPGVELCFYLVIVFCLFCLCTVVGLFGLRRWARAAMVPIGAIVCVCSALAGAGLIWARQFTVLLPPGPYSGEVQTAILCAVALCFLIALIGVWWIIYFCRARVKAAFRAGLAGEPAAKDNRVAP